MRKNKDGSWHHGNFFWGVNLNHAVSWQIAANRVLHAYGITIGQVFIGVLISKKVAQ